MSGTSVDPLRAFPSYASLLSFVLSVDLQTPLVGKLFELLIQHPNLTLSEMSKVFRAEEEKGENGGRNGVVDSLSLSSPSHHPSSTVRSPLWLETNEPGVLKSSGKAAIRSDAALRELITRLVLHRVVSCTNTEPGGAYPSRSGSGSAPICYYSLQSGTALLLRLYYPLALHWVRNAFGSIGERLARMVHQLGVVPLNSVIQTLTNAAVAAKENPPPSSLSSSSHSSRTVDCSGREHTRRSGGWSSVRQEQENPWIAPPARAKAWMLALQQVGLEMVRRGVLEVVSGGAMDGEQEEEQRKKSARKEHADVNSTSRFVPPPLVIPNWYIRWNVPQIVRLLLHTAMRQLIHERVADFSAGPDVVAVPNIVLDTFFTTEENAWMQNSIGASTLTAESLVKKEHSSQRGFAPAREHMVGREESLNAAGFPPSLPPVSTCSVSFAALVNAVQCHRSGAFVPSKRELLDDQVRRVLECLQEDVIGRNGLVGRSKLVGKEKTAAFIIGGALSMHDSNSVYHLHYTALCTAIRLTVVEKVILARHGVLGVRIFKLLMAHRFLEDKGLAELLVAAQPQTRELLHEMMKDGLLQQKEVSKIEANITSERQPKYQIYLWGLQAETQLIPRVRDIIAQSLLKAVMCLNTLRCRASTSLELKEESILQDPNFYSPLGSSSSHGGGQEAEGSPRVDSIKQEVADEVGNTFFPPAGGPSLSLLRNALTSAKGKSLALSKNVAEFEALVHQHRQLLGVESVVLAHMRMLFIMDFA